eukprot:scaffold2804_cov371-Prasinococcus_capsulatus_cf.AAC.25
MKCSVDLCQMQASLPQDAAVVTDRIANVAALSTQLDEGGQRVPCRPVDAGSCSRAPGCPRKQGPFAGRCGASVPAQTAWLQQRLVRGQKALATFFPSAALAARGAARQRSVSRRWCWRPSPSFSLRGTGAPREAGRRAPLPPDARGGAPRNGRCSGRCCCCCAAVAAAAAVAVAA